MIAAKAYMKRLVDQGRTLEARAVKQALLMVKKEMKREECLSRRTEFAKRGQELPQAKLLAIDVQTIRSAARQRESLRKHIAENLSNEALAKSFGVHPNTIEKVLSRETHSHLA